MNIIFFGKTFKRATQMLDEFVKNNELIGVEKLNRNHLDYRIELTDGTVYLAVCTNKDCKDLFYNYAYIDKLIDANDFAEYILPYGFAFEYM